MQNIPNYYLQIVAFFVGASVMILELIGTRILSPYFGTSINTLSLLIGFILGSLSIGYWYGGLYADKGVSKKDLSLLLFYAGTFITFIGIFHPLVIHMILSIPSLSLLGGTILACMSIFIIPNVFLGMINPFLAKLMLTTLKKTGTKMGNLSALSTIGSIIGTLASSFILIPFFGISTILFMLGLLLIGLALLLDRSKKLLYGIFICCILLTVFYFLPRFTLYLNKAGLVDIDTPYGKVLVYKQNNSTYLITGAFGYESKDSGSSPQAYLPNFDLILSMLLNNPKKALVLGGGTFSLSNSLLYHYPALSVDSVEIDKDITKIASSYFGYKDNPRHSIMIEDARTYINKVPDGSYDLVINDTYKDIVPPHHLLTQEAVKNVFNTLSSSGIYVSNVASALEGKKGWLACASYKTISSVFPHVYVVPAEREVNKNTLQTLLIIALKNAKKPLTTNQVKNIYDAEKFKSEKCPILTDDYAPVEYNLLAITAGNSTFHFSKWYLKTVLELTRNYFVLTAKKLLGYTP